VTRRGLNFNAIVEILMTSMRSHSIFINTPTISDTTGFIGYEEFKDFMILLALWDWTVNNFDITLNAAMHRTIRMVLKANSIYLELNA
jgi:hypothetical protein